MAKIEIGYGKNPQTVDIPDAQLLDILVPNEVKVELGEAEEIERGLDNPINSRSLEELVKGKKDVVIVTSDISRPMPSKRVLPHVIERLHRGGIEDSQITIVIALGSHRKQTAQEMETLLGKDVTDKIKCINSSDCEFVKLGQTTRGTPVELAKPVVDADFLICMGNVEYHYFAGYSGGAKAIMPGVSTRSAIQVNHRFMVQESACAGAIEGNPIREDIEEVATFCPIDFIVNVVLDEHKNVVRAVCGHHVDAHRAGCRAIDEFYLKKIPEKADIVVVSQGGAPKDLNLYQTQKALDNAKHAVADDGIIILVGACNEGMGEGIFEKWMTEADQPNDLIEHIQQDFQLGGHKAAAIAMILQKAKIFLVSEMDADFVKSIFMQPFTSVQEALDVALVEKGSDARILVMPYGGSTLPKVIAE